MCAVTELFSTTHITASIFYGDYTAIKRTYLIEDLDNKIKCINNLLVQFMKE